MRFNSIKRVQSELREKPEELIKVEITFPNRQMFIHLLMVIMEVNLSQKAFQCLHPGGKRGYAEDMMMSCVEAESQMW